MEGRAHVSKDFIVRALCVEENETDWKGGSEGKAFCYRD